MAHLIPKRTKKDFHGSIGELELYKKFKELSDEYYIFHSIEWMDNSRHNNRKTWGESDYVIFHPKRGIIVVEVKGGVVNYDVQNGVFKQHDIFNKKERILSSDPMNQALRSMHKYKEELNKKTKKINNLSYKWGSVVWFTGVASINQIINNLMTYSRGNTLTKKDYENMEETLNKVFDFYKMPINDNFTSIHKKEILNLFLPNFSIRPSLNDILIEEEEVIKRMTEEQMQVIDILEEEKFATIKGGAGTGKTLVALEKAKRYSDIGEKVLFIGYNKFLIEDLKIKYSKNLKNVEFITLNKLISNFKNIYPNNSLIDILKNFTKFDWNYKNIIIDEGQDFDYDYLKEFYNITQYLDGSLYIFYDDNQLINRRIKDNKWIDPINKSKLKLSINCRNTKNIAKVSYESIFNNNENIKIKSEIEGRVINYLKVENEQSRYNAIGKILTNLKEENINDSDIVIISLKSEENSSMKLVNKIGSFEFSSDLFSNKILKTTSRKFKGLEAKVVIIIDLDQENIKDDNIEELFYVASSRSKHLLYIVSDIEYEKLFFLIDNKSLMDKLIIQDKI